MDPKPVVPQRANDDDLRALATRLREQARATGDANVVATADRVHEHAHAVPPNGPHIREALAKLENQIALSPVIERILQALVNVGL